MADCGFAGLPNESGFLNWTHKPKKSWRSFLSRTVFECDGRCDGSSIRTGKHQIRLWVTERAVTAAGSLSSYASDGKWAVHNVRLALGNLSSVPVSRIQSVLPFWSVY